MDKFVKKFLFLILISIVFIPIGVSAKTHDYSLSAIDWDVTANDWEGAGTEDPINDGDFVEPGQVIKVNVDYSVGDNPVLGMQIGINYDSSVLEPIYDGDEVYVETDMSTTYQGGIWPAAGTSAANKKKTNWTIVQNDYNNSQIRLFITDSKLSAPLVTDGLLASVYFKVKDTASAGSVINLDIDKDYTDTDGSEPCSVSGISFTVYGKMSTDVSLKSLTLTGSNGLNYATNPVFSSGTSARKFSVIVPNSVTTIDIAAATTDSLASILSGGIGTKTLNVGDNSFNLVVQAQNGTQEIYVINIRRLSNVATLKTLNLSGVSLDYALASSIFTYTATVPYSVKQTTVSADTTDSNAVIVSGTGTFNFNNTGSTLNTQKIVVNAEDCDSTYASVPGNSCSSKEYTLNVTRIAPSSDNTLNDIKIDGVSIPSFVSSKDTYTLADVSNSTASIKVTGVLSDSKASLSGDGSKSLNVGDNTIVLKVTAEDGSVKNYTIKVRRLSNNANLASLSVTSNPQGVLSPNFNSTFYDYYTYTYDSTVKDIVVSGTLEDSNATITSGVGTYSSGDVSTNVVVTAEDGSIKTYIIKFSRNKSSDNTLKDLSVDGYNLDKTFSSSDTLYNVTVPGEVSSINVSALVNDSNASIVSGVGSHNLNYGTNTIQVRVKAENGSTKDYTINVTRSKKTISALSDLTVDSTTVSGFKENVYTYDYGTVPFSKTSIEIGATLKDSDATVSGIGTKTLKTGTNKFDVVVTAQDGKTTATYSITVFRTLSNNSYLSDLSVDGYDIGFVKTKNDYTLEVPYEVSSINLNATAEYVDATVSKTGPSSLAVGDNNYTIVVTAEDGSTNTYTLKVTRGKSTNVGLDSISVISDGTDYMTSFKKGIKTFNVSVPNEVSSVSIGAVLSDSLNSTVSGLGIKNLDTGLNTFTIKVTAASGDTEEYTLNITRKLNSNADLSSLVVVDHSLSPSFSSSKTSYTLTVSSEISQVMITATTASSTSSVVGIGLKQLQTGTNTFNIDVTAEDGTKKTYVVVITKKASNDSSLKSLTIQETILNETFSPTRTSYTANVSNGVSEVNISAVSNDSKARSVTGVGKVSLKTGDNTVNVTVTAEDNTTTVYTIIINRAKSMNADLRDITLSGGYSLDKEFNKDDTSYTVTVPNSVSSILVNAYKDDENATVTGAGNIKLNTGNNTVTITVVAEEATIKKVYTVNIFRALSNDSYLKDLTSTDGLITPSFDKDTSLYTLTVPYEVKNANLTAVKSSDAASVTIQGNTNLKVGNNRANIIVTAEDGTINTYYVDITRQPSSNNYLSNLEVLDNNGTNYISVFNKITLTYNINVDNSIDSLNFVATAEDSDTTIKGDGVKSISVGSNSFTIESFSANGTVRKYIINVTRAKNSNANLKSLGIDGQTLVPDFDPDTVSYSLNVTNSVSEVEITAEAEANTTKVSGTGKMQLQTGINTFNVTATAEDGTKKTYVIVVNKAASSNNYLASLLASVPFTPDFDRDVLDYNVTVSNTTTSINVQAVSEDANATVTGTGDFNLNVGNNSILIMVTAEDNTFRTYTLHVYREASDNNYLADLKIDGNTISNFSREKLDYDLSVSNDVTQLNIEGVCEDSNASVSGNKTWYLNTGVNTTDIVVTAENGDTRIYKITATRAKSSNNYLSSLSVLEGSLSPSFEKNNLEYQISVPYEVTSLSLTSVSEDSKAEIEIEGNVDFQIGNQNSVFVTVTAEDGSTKTYKLIVTRLPQANNFLSSLEVTSSSGKKYNLNPTFNKNTLNYTVDVDYNDTNLTISGTKEASSSTVKGFDTIQISNFPYVHKVVVTSAGGVEREYSITFNRIKSSNADLKDLSLSEGGLSPSFNPNVINYTATVAVSTSSVVVSATGFAGSSIVGDGVHSLDYGSNTISVVVTAEDGTLKTYTIDITREQEIVSTLSNIDVTGAMLSPTFSEGITDYVAYLGQDSTNVVITPTVKDILAKMYISKNDGNYQQINDITLTDFTESNIIHIKVEGSSSTTIYTVSIVNQSDEKITSKKYGHDISDGMIKTVKIGTSATQLKDQLDNDNDRLKIYKSDGVSEYNGDSVATGMIVKLFRDDKVIDQKIVVVKGDVDGNGSINALDALKVVNHIIETEKLSGCYLEAAEVTNDSVVNALDALKIVNHIIGNESLS